MLDRFAFHDAPADLGRFQLGKDGDGQVGLAPTADMIGRPAFGFATSPTNETALPLHAIPERSRPLKVDAKLLACRRTRRQEFG